MVFGNRLNWPEENSGITAATAQVEAAGINRTALKRYVDESRLSGSVRTVCIGKRDGG